MRRFGSACFFRFVGGFGDLRFSSSQSEGLWLLTGLPLRLLASVLVLIAWACSLIAMRALEPGESRVECDARWLVKGNKTI